MRAVLLVSEPILSNSLAEIFAQLAEPAEVAKVERIGQLERELKMGAAPELIFVVDPFDGCDPNELIASIHSDRPDIPIVLFSDFAGPVEILAAFERGVAGCIPRSTGSEIIVQALRLICAGGRYVPPDVLSGSAVPPMNAGRRAMLSTALTKRQRLVLALMSRGLSNREIAQELGINIGTVKSHVHTILRQLDAKSRTEAVIVALQGELVSSKSPPE